MKHAKNWRSKARARAPRRWQARLVDHVAGGLSGLVRVKLCEGGKNEMERPTKSANRNTGRKTLLIAVPLGFFNT